MRGGSLISRGIQIQCLSSMRKLGNFFSKLWDFWREEIERRVYKPPSLFACFFSKTFPLIVSLSMQFFFYVVVTLSTTTTDLHPRPINQLHTSPPNRSRPTLLSNDLRCMTNLVKESTLGEEERSKFWVWNRWPSILPTLKISNAICVVVGLINHENIKYGM